MPDYLLMVLDDEAAHAAESPNAMAELIDKQRAYAAELRRAERLRDSGSLRPTKHGKRVRRRGAALEAIDGPFESEDKALASYYWVRAGSLAEATELAQKCPLLAADEIDVRPVMKGHAVADKQAKPGKVFGFVVTGNAPSEAAWIKIMDRIDAETADGFPEEAFAGGLRLEPPKRGQRVATRGERRDVFDGPFLESKEVIGGVFFLRLRDMDEAVRWAAATPFVVHGALEIRELWRT